MWEKQSQHSPGSTLSSGGSGRLLPAVPGHREVAVLQAAKAGRLEPRARTGSAAVRVRVEDAVSSAGLGTVPTRALQTYRNCQRAEKGGGVWSETRVPYGR